MSNPDKIVGIHLNRHRAISHFLFSRVVLLEVSMTAVSSDYSGFFVASTIVVALLLFSLAGVVGTVMLKAVSTMSYVRTKTSKMLSRMLFGVH